MALPVEWDLRGFTATLGAERVLLQHSEFVDADVLRELKEISRRHGDVEQGRFLVLESHARTALQRVHGITGTETAS